MTEVGTVITLATALVLVVEFLRYRVAPLPLYGWLGVAVLLVGEGLMFCGVLPVNIYFTPIVWTGYLLLADAMVESISGRCPQHHKPKTFVRTGILSLQRHHIDQADHFD